jgi:Tetratricopeptide repeat
MKRRRAKFGAAAAAILLGVVFFGQGTDKAWSVGQTIAAMKKVETLHITGQDICGGEQVDFECWVAWPGADADVLRMRYQCGCERKTTVFVQGDTVYEYSPVKNKVHIMDGSEIEELQYWYEGAQLSPWLTGKMLETLKLILRAKLWKNLQWEGEPDLDAQVFTYNPEIPDNCFEFKVPEGASVIDEQTDQARSEQADQARSEREAAGRDLLNQAEHLFRSEKKYVEAAKIYQQVYDQYRDLNIGEHALMMVGLCHRRLGQPEKEIEAYEKTVSEYAHLKGWIEATYFYLGRAYLEQGQKDKALEAFENCLASGQGVRQPDQFPLKEARAAIAQIRAQ